jgi:hypothetical protein
VSPRRRAVLISLVAAIVVLVGAGAWWLQPQPLLPEAEASLASTPQVAFSRVDGRLEWAPVAGGYEAGLVLYPGGKVRPEAYGPLAQRIASEGFLVIVVPVPLNLAVLGIDAARPAMAAQYASDASEPVRGLALWASYAATDLSGTSLAVVSVYGSLDAGAARMSGTEARAALPPDAELVEVAGGNHEQMGWYTGQPNDPAATITRGEQQRQVVEATVAMLRRMLER